MACGILVPKQGMNPGPHPGSTVLTTGLPGKPLCGHFKSSGICSPIYHLPLYTVSGLNVFRAVRPPPRVSGKEPMSPEPRDPWLIGLHSAASHPVMPTEKLTASAPNWKPSSDSKLPRCGRTAGWAAAPHGACTAPPSPILPTPPLSPP